jgi:hypothetical protein
MRRQRRVALVHYSIRSFDRTTPGHDERGVAARPNSNDGGARQRSVRRGPTPVRGTNRSAPASRPGEIVRSVRGVPKLVQRDGAVDDDGRPPFEGEDVAGANGIDARFQGVIRPRRPDESGGTPHSQGHRAATNRGRDRRRWSTLTRSGRKYRFYISNSPSGSLSRDCRFREPTRPMRGPVHSDTIKTMFVIFSSRDG